MASLNETHPLAVYIYIRGNNNPKSIFEKGYWREMARCARTSQAEEVALCLSLRNPQGVQLAELVEDQHGARFVGYKFIPESARDLVPPFVPGKATEQQLETIDKLRSQLRKSRPSISHLSYMAAQELISALQSEKETSE